MIITRSRAEACMDGLTGYVPDCDMELDKVNDLDVVLPRTDQVVQVEMRCR